MLVLVVGSQRERAGRGRCSSLLVNGDKKEGEKRAKRNPNQFFAPSARCPVGKCLTVLLFVVHAMQSNGYLTGELNWKDKCIFLMH